MATYVSKLPAALPDVIYYILSPYATLLSIHDCKCQPSSVVVADKLK